MPSSAPGGSPGCEEPRRPSEPQRGGRADSPGEDLAWRAYQEDLQRRRQRQDLAQREHQEDMQSLI
ncbi:hypothetical protein Hte_012499 [Hypoxylon texense]